MTYETENLYLLKYKGHRERRTPLQFERGMEYPLVVRIDAHVHLGPGLRAVAL